MSSFERIRQEVTAAVEAIRPLWTEYELKVEYENELVVNTDIQKLPFLCVKIMMLDGTQADLADNPVHRMMGQIHLATAVPNGSGTAKANKVNEFFFNRLQRKRFGGKHGTRTKLAMPAPKIEHGKWTYYPVLIPFWSDQLTN